jgi:hypothetical protein
MSQPASWFPDPYGRFEQRYFDGAEWTAQVISNGKETVDPLGATVSVPFATPTGAPVRGFLRRLRMRWFRRRRR